MQQHWLLSSCYFLSFFLNHLGYQDGWIFKPLKKVINMAEVPHTVCICNLVHTTVTSYYVYEDQYNNVDCWVCCSAMPLWLAILGKHSIHVKAKSNIGLNDKILLTRIVSVLTGVITAMVTATVGAPTVVDDDRIFHWAGAEKQTKCITFACSIKIFKFWRLNQLQQRLGSLSLRIQ